MHRHATSSIQKALKGPLKFLLLFRSLRAKVRPGRIGAQRRPLDSSQYSWAGGSSLMRQGQQVRRTAPSAAHLGRGGAGAGVAASGSGGCAAGAEHGAVKPAVVRKVVRGRHGGAVRRRVRATLLHHHHLHAPPGSRCCLVPMVGTDSDQQSLLLGVPAGASQLLSEHSLAGIP